MRARNRGASLIETLVVAAITGLLLTALMQIFDGMVSAQRFTSSLPDLQRMALDEADGIANAVRGARPCLAAQGCAGQEGAVIAVATGTQLQTYSSSSGSVKTFGAGVTTANPTAGGGGSGGASPSAPSVTSSFQYLLAPTAAREMNQDPAAATWVTVVDSTSLVKIMAVRVVCVANGNNLSAKADASIRPRNGFKESTLPQ